MNINRLILRPVICITTGKKYQITEKIVVDKRITKVKYLILSESETKYYLPIQKIKSNGNNAIMINGETDLINAKDFELKGNEYIINIHSEIYTYLGNFVATLNNITIDNFKVISLSLINKEKDVTSIISSGENIIIVDDMAKKYRKKKLKLTDIKVTTE